MDGTYQVHFMDRVVGSISLETKGLYCHYHCACKLAKDQIYRVVAFTNDKQINMGVCVPKGECWETKGRFPIRLISSPELHFEIVCDENKGEVCPLDPQLPFEHIANLDSCVFVTVDHKPGLTMQWNCATQKQWADREDTDSALRS